MELHSISNYFINGFAIRCLNLASIILSFRARFWMLRDNNACKFLAFTSSMVLQAMSYAWVCSSFRSGHTILTCIVWYNTMSFIEFARFATLLLMLVNSTDLSIFSLWNPDFSAKLNRKNNRSASKFPYQ
jgi:hypothetical protein